MFSNYLKVAFRNLRNNKFYSAVSIFGLAIGLTAGILILLWCKDEKSYSRSVRGSADIYRAVPLFNSGAGKGCYFPTVPPALAGVSGQVPGIQKTGRVFRNGDEMIFKSDDRKFSEKNSALIDAELFSILDIPFVAGSNATPFPNDESIVLTEPMAKKYFGNQEAIGKTLQRVDKKQSYVVTGVVRIPHNSQLNYDYFLPLSSIKGIGSDWADYDFEEYLRLTPGTAAASVAAKLTQLQKANTTDDLTKTLTYRLQPLAQVHLYNPDGSDGSIAMVRIFTVVAVVILLIASINYVNLTTAKAAQRAREIGVRKVIGAGKRQLFFQFIGESVIVFLLAMAVSIGLIKGLFPFYNRLTGKDLVFTLVDPAVLQVLGVTMAVTLIVSAIYPAILLSSFKPLQAIKGRSSIGSGNPLLRKLLVVGQFTFSVIFILSTIVIGRQLTYIRAKHLGLDKENVFRLDMKKMYGNYAAVKSQLQREPSISGVTGIGQNILWVESNTTMNDWAGKEPGRTELLSTIPIERDFLSVMHIPLVEGKGFSGTAADSGYFLLNETAIREMGLKDPVGKRFSLWDRKGTIAGVVRDFHFKDMHEKIGPCVLFWRPEWISNLYVRTTGANSTDALAAVAKLWKTYNADYPFEYTFLDDAYNKMYATDQRTGVLFNVFAVIAIFISCLGLLGLVTYAAQLKTREIGIRKVLGASVFSVTRLLAKDFVGLVLLTIGIASPVGWYLMDRWLQDFAYRTAISWWIFPVAGAAALAIAVLTISFQAIKAALANPVKSLRTE